MDNPDYTRTPYTFDRVVRIIFSIVGLLGAIYLLYILRNVLLPFMVACLIAYIIEPIVKFNCRLLHCKKRFLPVMATLVELLALLGVFCWIFVPYLVSECTEMAEALRKYATTQIKIPYVSQQIHDFIRDNVNFYEISRWMTREEWMKLAKSTLSSSWTFVSSSVGFIISLIGWLVVLLYLVFIMIDYDHLTKSFRSLIPPRHRRRTLGILDDVKTAMNRYFRGQFIIAMTVGVLFAIGFLIIDLPMAVVLGLFIGILNLVPYLQLISLPITIVLCAVAYISGGVDFWWILGESMAVYVIVQLIQDLILTPKIMGKAMGLNPAIILLSLSIWGSLLGFLGLIIALPLTTLILSYYDRYLTKTSMPREAEHKG